MRFSSLFVASLAVAILSSALLLCGLSGTAISQTATPSGGATTSLPNVVVEAPKQVAYPQKPKAARGGPQHRVPSDIANHSNAIGVADVASRAACEACECHWQLRRWLRNKL